MTSSPANTARNSRGPRNTRMLAVARSGESVAATEHSLSSVTLEICRRSFRELSHSFRIAWKISRVLRYGHENEKRKGQDRRQDAQETHASQRDAQGYVGRRQSEGCQRWLSTQHRRLHRPLHWTWLLHGKLKALAQENAALRTTLASVSKRLSKIEGATSSKWLQTAGVS